MIYYNIDFLEYDFIETNIVKLTFTNLGTPIILLHIYRSTSTDINIFKNALSKMIRENKKKLLYCSYRRYEH